MASQCRPTRSVARAGFEPALLQGLSLAAVPVRVPCRRSSAPGGIRTRDLHLDRVASTPGCSTRACVVLRSRSRAPGGSRTHSSTLARWQASRYITGACVNQSPRQESNLRGRLTTTAGCRYITGAVRQCPRQESNLVFNLRRVACGPAHPEDDESTWRESNPQLRFGRPARSRLRHRYITVRPEGLEPSQPD